MVKQLTGAQVIAMAEDVDTLKAIKPGGKEHPIDKIIHDGESVMLGGVKLVAHLTAGHTPGCTTWTTVVRDGGKDYNVMFHCSLRAARIMAEQRHGVILAVSSGGATKAHRGNVAYDAAKGGIEAMVRGMALDLGPYGVRVCGLVPGSIDTQGMDPETKASRGETVPLRRVGEAEDLAGPAVFLVSDDAAYISGTMLVVDGGLLAQQRSPQVDIFPLSKYPNLPPR